MHDARLTGSVVVHRCGYDAATSETETTAARIGITHVPLGCVLLTEAR